MHGVSAEEAPTRHSDSTHISAEKWCVGLTQAFAHPAQASSMCLKNASQRASPLNEPHRVTNVPESISLAPSVSTLGDADWFGRMLPLGIPEPHARTTRSVPEHCHAPAYAIQSLLH